MRKTPPDQTQYLQFQNYDPSNLQNDISPQSAIQNEQKQYFYIKLTLSVFMVILATTSVQTQMQYFAPFVRNVQNFFNFHILKHNSQDIYEGGSVIYYRTQQYRLRPRIMEFFDNYVNAMETFNQNSFFYPQQSQQSQFLTEKPQIVKILIISQINEAYRQKDMQIERNQEYFKEISKDYNFKSRITSQDRYLLTAQQQQWILQRPIKQLAQFFKSTVFTKKFYQIKIKRIQLTTNLYIKFKEGKNCTVEVKTIGLFYSLMMMSVKIETNVYDAEEQALLKNLQQQDSQEDDHNLGIRKLSAYHNLNFSNQYLGYAIFAVNCFLFCIELMIIVRTNAKIEQNLNQEKEFQRQLDNFNQLQKKKNSPKTPPQQLHTFMPEQQLAFQAKNQNIRINNLSYRQRLQIIGTSNLIELILSFLVLVTVQSKGLVCFFCWIKMSIYLSQTGNKMMIGFLLKRSLSAYLKVILNLLIWLSAFVFFSMVTYRITKKFQSVQLSYYEYIFNYFQYGIFENFKPIQRYGSFYSFLYFLQVAFLVMMGSNILQSILAQQVLKNSNMKDLIEFIESIQVQCPNCHSPPQVKKKIKLKLPRQSQRQSQFISRYFKTQKQLANKSKYEIKILSPEFSPMFHTSQFKKKQPKLRKLSINNISIVSEQQIVNSPYYSPLIHGSPMTLGSPIAHGSPRYALNPYGPYSPGRNIEEKKKVKFQIGRQVQQGQFGRYKKTIKRKSQAIMKILRQITRQPSSIDMSVDRHFHIQILKKKLEEIKKLINKIQ